MIGFATSVGLLGIAGLAWPIYLHMRRRQRQQVQIVPSLQIFGTKVLKRRQRHVEHLLLLLSRIAILTALFVWVSQPFLESHRQLPLGKLNLDDHSLQRHLVVIVDDGITAWHGRTLGARLVEAKETIRTTLEGLPEDVRVAVVTTTFPHATDFLERRRAIELIEGLTVIPKEGDGTAALSTAAEQLRDRTGALLVVAPRDGDLWRVSSGSDSVNFATVHFHDLTDVRLPAYIQGIGEENGGIVVSLVGDGDELEGESLAVHNLSGGSTTRRISLQESLRGRVRLEAGELGTKPGTAVKLIGVDHPWARAYSTCSLGTSRSSDVVTFLERGEESLVAAKIVRAVLISLHPDLQRRFVFADETDDANLPNASAVVIIGSPALSLSKQSWLARRIVDGAQVLVLPTTAAASPDLAAMSPMLPTWGSKSQLEQRFVTPLTLDMSGVPETHRFDEILVSQIRKLNVGTLREPRFSGASRAVVKTASGQTVIALHRPNGDSGVWAVGIPFDVSDGSLVFHPVFPLLFDWLLFPRGKSQTPLADVRVGATVRAVDWFSGYPHDARVFHLRGRNENAIESPRGWLAVDEAGFYELRSESNREPRAANDPRPNSHSVVSRQEWQRMFSPHGVEWLDGGDISLDDLSGSAISTDKNGRVRYDLTALLATLLLSALFLEAVCLGLCWRLRGAAPGGA